MKKKETIVEEARKAISNLFKPFIKELEEFEKAVKKMKEDEKKVEEVSIRISKNLKKYMEQSIRDDLGSMPLYESLKKTEVKEHGYTCPECKTVNWFESEVTTIRCDKCDHVFNIEIQRAIKETMDLAKCDDWKILDVNCLSEIINERCEVQMNTIGWNESRSYKENDFNLIIKCLLEGAEYRYRKLSTPTKKTHEELAEEYIREDREFINTYPLTYIETVNLVKSKCVEAFIAGRKSMECDKSPEVKKRIHGLDW